MLETRPAVLRRTADRLWKRYERGHPLSPDERDALAEACFRLGVQPDAEPEVAVSQLARAHRVDPGNPKHSYHLGLAHLRHGRLDAALEWLTAAAESAPTNHRIWAHLAIVHRALHETAPDGDHRRRAADIVEAVRAGRDDIAPTDDQPVSLLRPGRCRWSGIHDINAEFDLQLPTGKRGQRLVTEALTRTADLASARPGGTASFTVLAVQWLVLGYSPATVRRLAGVLPPEDDSALLDLVCELFEIDEELLPARLATCLAEERLPDLLIALIHQRRLLWRPLRLNDISAYTAARQFAAGEHDSVADAHLDAMESAARALTDASPTAPLDDLVEDTGPAAAPDIRLAGFERDADLVTRLRERAVALAKKLNTSADRARVQADHALLTDVGERLEAARLARLNALHEFMRSPELQAHSEEFDIRLERCEKSLQQAIGLKRLLNVIRKKLRAGQEESANQVPPSDEAAAIAADLEALSPKPGAEPPAVRQDTAPRAPRERVAAAVATVEAALDGNAAHAWQTLDAYPPHLRRRPALVLLRSYLNGHLAEARHRMGQHTAARRHWQAMLTENPMSGPVLHNLAVAHTSAGDLSSAAQTWNRRLEALYMEALLTGEPTRGAAERAEIHRVLAGSFGTAALCGREPDENAPLRGIPAELTSPARVALALAHLRLEELNHALTYRSAVLRLGVARSIRRAQLDEAYDARLNLTETACVPLPSRVRAPFEELCRSTFRAAYETARDPGGRVRETTDAAEEEARSAWILGRVRWKQRITRELTTADDWPVTESSGEILASLRLIDELRLDPQDETLRRTVHRLGSGDPARYLDQLNDLAGLATGVAVHQIFRAAEQRLDHSTDFPDRYRRIYLSWQRNDVPDQYLDLLDDPQEVYLPSVEPAIDLLNASGGAPTAEARQAVLAALPAMEHWVTRLRGASGPAALLGELLHAVGEQHKAQKLLARARADAFARESLARVRLAIECDDHTDAIALLRGLAEKRERRQADSTDVRTLMITAYQRWIISDQPPPPATQIRKDLGRWHQPAAVHARRFLVVDATIKKHQRRPGELDPESLAIGLRQLLHDDEQNTFARYHLAQLLHQHAVQVRKHLGATAGQQRDALRDQLVRLCTECATHAAELLDETTDPHHVLNDPTRRLEVRNIYQQVRSYHR